MCGRYMVITEGEIIEMQAIFEELGKRLDRSGDPFRADGSEVFPGSVTPVIVRQEEQIVMLPMLWGFRKWDDKGIIINARSETASQKPLFRDSLRSRRCIIPSKGFYEWRRSDISEDSGVSTDVKDKFLIRRQDSPFYFMAGIWRRNEDRTEFAILTMPSVSQMQSIHDRMPLSVPANRLTDWLSDPAVIDDLRTDTGSDITLEILRV